MCMAFNITIADEDDDGQSVAVISEEQADTIRKWLDTIKAGPPEEEKFLAWVGAESIDKIQASRFAPAVAFFKKRAAELAKGVAG